MQNKIRGMNVNSYGLINLGNGRLLGVVRIHFVVTLILGCWLLTGCSDRVEDAEKARLAQVETEKQATMLASRAEVLSVVSSEKPGAAQELARRYNIHQKQFDDSNFMENLLMHQNPVIRRNVVMALGYVEHSTNLNILCKVMDDEDPEVRRAALRTITTLYPEGSQLFLLPNGTRFYLLLSLKDSSWKVRTEAVTAISKLKDPSYIPKVAALLDDADEYVRYEVVRTMCRFARLGYQEEVLAALEKASQELPEKQSRRLELILRVVTGSQDAAEQLLNQLYGGDWTYPMLSLQKLSESFPELTAKQMSIAMRDGQVPTEHKDSILSVVAIAPDS